MIWSRSYSYICPECGKRYQIRPAFFSLKSSPDTYQCRRCRAIIPITSERYDYYVYYARNLCVMGTFLYFTIHGVISDSPMDWGDILFMTLAIGVLGGHFAGYVLSLPVGAIVELTARTLPFKKAGSGSGINAEDPAAMAGHGNSRSFPGTAPGGTAAALKQLFQDNLQRWTVFFQRLGTVVRASKGIITGIILYFFLHAVSLSLCGLLTGFYIGAHDLSDHVAVKSVAASLPVMIRIFDFLGAVAAGFLCSLMVKEEEVLSSVAVAVIVVLLKMTGCFLLDPLGFSLLSHWFEVIIFLAIIFGGGLKRYGKTAKIGY